MKESPSQSVKDEVKSPASEVVPQGVLKILRVDEIKPSTNNPRLLFDKNPLDDLRENIGINGVLVPITVYQLKGQDKYGILDGERRYQCCIDLLGEGIEIEIPANIVQPPDKIAGILYMFSIHNFREQWELMPTALSLRTVMNSLKEYDNQKLVKLTGLSEPQIERCKILLQFSEEFQNLSLDPNPKTRIPANFWIEANPVLDLCEKHLSEQVKEYSREGITRRLVEKYRQKKIKSVIHFRRILEAFDISEGEPHLRKAVVARLREYIEDIDLETRNAFDEFIIDTRRVQNALGACDDFIRSMERSKVEHNLDRKDLIAALNQVSDYVEMLLIKLEGSDEPLGGDEDINELAV